MNSYRKYHRKLRKRNKYRFWGGRTWHDKTLNVFDVKILKQHEHFFLHIDCIWVKCTTLPSMNHKLFQHLFSYEDKFQHNAYVYKSNCLKINLNLLRNTTKSIIFHKSWNLVFWLSEKLINKLLKELRISIQKLSR